MVHLDLSVHAQPVVLVVNGDADERARTVERLEHAGYRSIACASAAEALRHSGESLDVVITAIALEGDDDGASLTRQLKDRADELVFLPVLVVGDEQADTRVRAFEAGCDDYLGSDVSFFELDARIRSLLAHRWHYLALADANLRLQEAQAKKKELAALLVHDMRNPLSALQGNIDFLYDELAADPNVAGVIADSQELCRKALSMVASILDVEELEAGLLVAMPSDVQVAEFLRHVSRHHKVPIQIRRLNLELDVDEGLTAAFDVDLVSRVIENLLDNAVRYAPAGGKVVMAAHEDEGVTVLSVGNNGPPIADAERGKIFDRFYRIDERRAGARANRGLGLYFCMLVAEAHGGTISVESRDDLPTCFIIRLPKLPRSSASLTVESA